MFPVTFAGDAIASSRLFETLYVELEAGLSTLADKPEENVVSTLCALWHCASGRPLSAAIAADAGLPVLGADEKIQLRELLARRVEGIPLAHLTGRQRFMGIELLSGKDALIPRGETELLGNAALGLLNALAENVEQPVVVDVCTGSGNLATALAHLVPRARVYASDLSEEAVVLARKNFRFHGLEDRVEARQGDLLEPFESQLFLENVDLLVCNPPYISSQRVDVMPAEISGFEPRLAFDGGPLGVRILNKLVREAPRFLRKGGWLAFEVGLGQGKAVLHRLDASGAFVDIRPVLDASGEIRALVARRPD